MFFDFIKAFDICTHRFFVVVVNLNVGSFKKDVRLLQFILYILLNFDFSKALDIYAFGFYFNEKI